MGAAGHLGEILDLFDNSCLPLGFMQTDARLRTREENNTFPKDLVAELPFPKTSSWEPDWLSCPQRAQSCVVISCLSLSHFPLGSSSLPFPPEVSAAQPTALPGPSCTATSFLFFLSVSAFLIPRLPLRKEGFCSVTRLLKGLHPSKTGGCLAYF